MARRRTAAALKVGCSWQRSMLHGLRCHAGLLAVGPTLTKRRRMTNAGTKFVLDHLDKKFSGGSPQPAFTACANSLRDMAASYSWVGEHHVRRAWVVRHQPFKHKKQGGRKPVLDAAELQPIRRQVELLVEQQALGTVRDLFVAKLEVRSTWRPSALRPLRAHAAVSRHMWHAHMWHARLAAPSNSQS
jgi:hypothetical protein